MFNDYKIELLVNCHLGWEEISPSLAFSFHDDIRLW